MNPLSLISTHLAANGGVESIAEMDLHGLQMSLPKRMRGIWNLDKEFKRA